MISFQVTFLRYKKLIKIDAPITVSSPDTAIDKLLIAGSKNTYKCT